MKLQRTGFYSFLINELNRDSRTRAPLEPTRLGSHVLSDRYEILWVREKDAVTYVIFWSLHGPEKFLLGTSSGELDVDVDEFRSIDVARFEVRTDADRRRLVMWVRKNLDVLLTGELPRGFSS